jgi:hypothetical protein
VSDDYSNEYAEFRALIRTQLAAGNWAAAVHNLRVVADVMDEWDISEMSAEEVADVATNIAWLRAQADAIEDTHKRHVQ